MQQLPVLSAVPLVPARPGQGTGRDLHGPGPRPDVVDLRHSQRPARQPDPTVRERWSRASTASERSYGRTGGSPGGGRAPAPAATALPVVAPGFVAQLIGQIPGVQSGAAGRGQALTATLASSAYRQAGAEPAQPNPTAQHLDIAV